MAAPPDFLFFRPQLRLPRFGFASVSASYTHWVGEKPEVVDHYGSQYRDFAADVYGEVRRGAFGEDVGQNSWLTASELEGFASGLELQPTTRLLDVGCGSGGPALHLARATGCSIVGVDFSEEAVANGSRIARELRLQTRAQFVQADASQRLPFDSGSFEAVLCIDAVNHLRGRPHVLAEWARLLTPGGRLLFTDPVIVTGPLGSDELALRTSIGYFVLMPPQENERLLSAAGLRVVSVEDTTESLAQIAHRRGQARAERADTLKPIEGNKTFEARQRFFEIVATLAHERRLSRLAFLAKKPN